MVLSWDGIVPDTMMNSRIRNGIVRIRFVIVIYVSISYEITPENGVQATYIGYTDTEICVGFGIRDCERILSFDYISKYLSEAK